MSLQALSMHMPCVCSPQNDFQQQSEDLNVSFFQSMNSNLNDRICCCVAPIYLGYGIFQTIEDCIETCIACPLARCTGIDCIWYEPWNGLYDGIGAVHRTFRGIFCYNVEDTIEYTADSSLGSDDASFIAKEPSLQ